MYELRLNGRFYGTGNLDYMNELIHDYLIVNELYGRDNCSFEILKLK